MRPPKKKITCYIISETSLGIQCATYIIKEGHKLLGIISPDSKVHQWAIDENVPYISSIEEFEKLNIPPKSFDYLFSMVNYKVMPKSLLELPRCYSINYHDSILPKYAGVHATSWSILNNESFHGVSWHIMNDVIDAGDILQQYVFSIDNNETAFSLNLKCYMYAAKIFKKLIRDLSMGAVKRKQQQITERTYFSLYQKPPCFGFLQWDLSAEEIERTYRALSFGHYQNMFATFKILIKEAVYVPSNVSLLSTRSGLNPGTVLQIEEDKVVIATKTQDIEISNLKSLSDKSYSIREIVEQHKISVGSQLQNSSEKIISFLEKHTEELSRAEKFWRINLKNILSVQLLPIDYMLNIEEEFVVSTKPSFFLEKNTCFAETILTAFFVYLHHIGNSYPFTVGLVTSFFKKLPRVVTSLFSEYVPLTCSIPRGLSAGKAVDYVRDLVEKLERNKAYLKDVVIRYPELESSNCSFPVSINIGDFRDFSLKEGGFLLNINEQDKSYSIHIKNSSPQIIKLVKECSTHITHLFEQIMKFPDKPIDSFFILTPEEEKRILGTWNETDRQYRSDVTIYQIFQEQVEKTPDSIAIACEESQVTYKELSKRVDQLANYLFEEGVICETFVAVLLDRGIDLLVSILAITKTSGVYIPLDPSAPIDRNTYILEDANPTIVITNKHYAQYAGNYNTFCIETLECLPQLCTTNIFPIPNPLNIAYVIYTSGSTGKPKGVMVHHEGMMNHIFCKINDLKLSSSDIIAQTATQIFDISIWQFLTAIVIAGKVVVFTDEEIGDPLKLIEVVSRSNITILELVPTYAFALLEAMHAFQKLRVKWNIKCLLLTGEALTADLCNQFLKLDHHIKVINAYGPTECSDDVTHYIINKSLKNSFRVPIGKPVNNIKCYVLNSNLSPLPSGVTGELYIGGIGLARGYLNRPDLTAEKFIANIFQPGTRLYKTGDLARWLPEGILEYVGRNDSQIKMRGYRIELGEIEEILNSYKGITQSIVVVKKDDNKPDKQYLVGYYVSDSILDEHDIYIYLKSKLPEYMIPSVLMHLNKIPLTVNGKLDRKALPDLKKNHIEGYVGPRNKLEKMVCQILAEILSLPEDIVGIQNDFFELGGDSITSIQLVSRLRQRLGLNLTVKDIFTYSTIETLYDNILQQKESSKPQLKTEQGMLKGVVKTLPIQEWFFGSNYLVPYYWNQVFAIKVPTLDINKLQRSIEKLVLHHDALRFRYKSNNGKTEQYYDNSPLIEELKILDISTLSIKEDSSFFAQALQEIIENWQSTFNLEKGPIYCISYIHGYKDRSARIYFAVHHLAIDTISWRILTEDLMSIYNGFDLGPKGSSYRQWVETVYEYGRQHFYEQSYWNEVLSDYKEDILGNQVVNEETKNYVSLKLDKKTTKQLLQESNGTYGTTINDILLTALAYMLADITDCKANHILLEGHGREEIDSTVDITRTLGWFTTIYPLRIEVQDNIGNSLRNTKESIRQVPNKGIGYGVLMGYKNIPLPKVIFNYLGQFGTEGNSAAFWNIINENIGLWTDSQNHDPYILTINGIIIDGCFEAKVTSKLDVPQTKRAVELFKQHLESIIYHCVGQTRSYLTASDVDKVVFQSYLDSLQKHKEIEGVYLANSLQQGFIYHFLNQGISDDAYKVQNIWEYHTPLDSKKLQQAWIFAQKRYSCLRLRFAWAEELVQVIDKKGQIDWRYVDMSGEENQTLSIKKIQEKDRMEPYWLEEGSLFRLYLIKQKKDLYTCLLSDHHTILDGWSIPVLLNFVHDTYLKLLDNEKILIAKDRSYEEAQKYLQTHQGAHLDYWKEYTSQVEDSMDMTSLLIDKNVDLSEYKYIKEQKEKEIMIEGSFYKDLKDLGKKNGITLSTMLQYAWHKTLNIYSRNTQTIIGIVVSGRDLPVDNIVTAVGLYINTVPLIINHEEEISKSLIAIMKKLQNTINEINSKSNVNLAKLQVSGKRLFDSLFVYENYPVPVNEHHKEKIKVKFINTIEKIDYPLGIVVYEREDKLIIKLKYASELFNIVVINQLLCGIKVCLEKILSYPDKEHRLLQWVEADAYNQILNEWNSTYKSFPNNKTIHQIFEEQVEKTPDRIALFCQENYLTYKKINEKANQLAHYLASTQPIKPGVRVVLCLKRNQDILIAILAVLKIGAVYVPVDVSYPLERIRCILDDTNALFVLTCVEYKPFLAKTKTGIIDIDTEDFIKKIALEPNTNFKDTVTSSNLAYIIYSSGTTGSPKGIMIAHKSVVNLSIMQGEKFALLGKKDARNCLWYSNYVFDAHVSELYTALLNGHTVHLITDEIRHDINLLNFYIQYKKIDIATIPPVILNDQKILDLSTLVVAGDKTSKKILDAYKKSYKKVINAYGPTEATVCVSLKEYNSHDSANNIGFPLSNMTCYVLDSYLNLLPIGAVGELYIGGVGLAQGYLNKPDLTAESFVANPFSKEKGARLYKTGDLVRWMSEENGLEYMGRKDSQVKIRGHRIELDEIESILAEYLGIKQCAIVIKEQGDAKHLIGYYSTDDELAKDDIFLYLKAKLPEYMVPSMLTHLRELPVTINGKLDRKALPEPTFIPSKNHVAPRNTTEKKLCQIWADTLQLPENQVGIHDDFFELGGDSILAILLVNNLTNSLNMQINISSLFQYKTVDTLLNYLQSNALQPLEGHYHEF